MIDALISSKTRIKLLLKFFLNTSTTAYLRGLGEEFGESTNGIRVELNRFEEAGMLKSFSKGNKKIFKVNTGHPLFNDLHNIVLKFVGLDKIVESVISRLGNLEKVYVIGNFARGLDGDIIDLVFVGDVNKTYLLELVEKAEVKINRKIRFVTFVTAEFAIEKIKDGLAEPLLLWSK
ncbi:MAG: ArsR family transcriptional regulator [Bacteroidetes bacterium]|nr:ArsR family transcriptional regulator [Bacteroidota bacterium]